LRKGYRDIGNWGHRFSPRPFFFYFLSPIFGHKKASLQAGFFAGLSTISAWLLPSSALQRAWQQHQQPEQPVQQRQRAWLRQRPEREPGQQPEREQQPEPERACCKQQRTGREGQQRGGRTSFVISFIDQEWGKESIKWFSDRF
jgi:hypothetical protein